MDTMAILADTTEAVVRLSFKDLAILGTAVVAQGLVIGGAVWRLATRMAQMEVKIDYVVLGEIAELKKWKDKADGVLFPPRQQGK